MGSFALDADAFVKSFTAMSRAVSDVNYKNTQNEKMRQEMNDPLKDKKVQADIANTEASTKLQGPFRRCLGEGKMTRKSFRSLFFALFRNVVERKPHLEL
ncbi:MAG: hypothetical protein FWD68_07330 [Alphaproteobacteria bacterium]|nr:hypothetical protein [Alphaproteobacteria bacterium]